MATKSKSNFKQVRCKSGIIGWQGRLRFVYTDLNEFLRHDSMYHISDKLGFDYAEEAWEKNPILRGSVIPADLEIVKN